MWCRDKVSLKCNFNDFFYLGWVISINKSSILIFFFQSALQVKKELHSTETTRLFLSLCSCAFSEAEFPSIIFPILPVKHLDCQRARPKLLRTWWDCGVLWALSGSQNSGKAANISEWNANYSALHCYTFLRMTGKLMHDGWRNYFLCSLAAIQATSKERNLVFCPIYLYICSSMQSSDNKICFFNQDNVSSQFLQ